MDGLKGLLIIIKSFGIENHHTRNPKHVIIAKYLCNIQQKDVIHRKLVIYRGKREDYMFSEHVIFSPDKLHVRLRDYIRNLEITCFRYEIHLITKTCNL